MKDGRGPYGGILADDEFRGRMRMVAARNRRLAGDYRRRAEVRRGSGTGVSSRPPSAGSDYRRRVIVKVKHYDRAKGARPNMTGVILQYLEKDGSLRDRDGREVDREELAREWEHDRRVFHFIVSPNDGHRFTEEELAGGRGSVAAEILARWERRAGPLEAAVSVESKPDAAHPEGNRHLHVAVRGVQGDRDLFLRQELITQRFREDAEDVVTDRLGYMTERERHELELRMERNALERERERGRDRTPERERELERDDGRTETNGGWIC
jgi:hypothetical protein